jgi:hypothetical protein
MQYLPDAETGIVRQRELYFKDPDRYKNAHREADKRAELKTLSLDDFTWNPGCDFYLTTSANQTKVSGRIEAGACVLFNQGLNKDMYADDAVEITATEYAFHGRFVDADGNVLWGTASEELNRMVRQPRQ